jgi:two-component system cell cycle sensor histidine kinase PleC
VDVAIGAALGDAAAETKERLVLDQLRIALYNLKPNHFLMPVFGAILCAMFSPWIAAWRLAVWYGLLVVSVIPLGIVCIRFLKTRIRLEDRQKWIAWATASYAFHVIAWALLGFFLWAPGNELNNLLIMLILCCTLAGSTTMVGASAPIAFTAYAVYGGIVVLAPLQGHGFLYVGLSLLAGFYTIYLAWMSKQFFTTTRNMLMLRNDKNELIAALALSKEQSDIARYRAENASRTKSQFLANMSHELRTPLNAILGFSELIQSRTFADDLDRHVEYANLIHTSGAHLLTLINDILDLAKIEAGGITLQEHDVALDRLIEDCIRLMIARAQAGGLDLQADVSACLPHLTGDERAVKQILLNLLANAVKFTPKGGSVTVFAHPGRGGGLYFGVQDTGVGIAPEDQTHVFENFGQGRHDVVIADKGTGLGLPIVKGLVEAHGASVALESEPGSGTKITILWPEERTRRMQTNEPLRAAS